MQDVQTVRDYYLVERDHHRNIYQIWEAGGAFNDSVTPSTWCEEYRQWIVEQLERQLRFVTSKKVLSVGCGNAFVEQCLCQKGYNVDGMDINESAVQLAQHKGVSAVVGDIYDWEPEEKNIDLIYCDGVLGHLYVEETGCQVALDRLRSWLKSEEGILLISNDASKDGGAVARAPGVKGFFHFSEQFVISELRETGFELVETASYLYHRPLSGPRRRLVVVGRAVGRAGLNH
jgi:SAM-dependent methyltransferase